LTWYYWIILMVGLDGIETLEIIKRQPQTCHLKVVIESGLSDLEDMDKAKKWVQQDTFLNHSTLLSS